MKQKIKNLQTQKLILSQEIQTSLHILSLDYLELKNYIESEIDKNPLLEKVRKKSYRASAPFPIETLEKKPSIFEKLFLQAREEFFEKELEIAKCIIGNLDEKGFLDVEIKKIAKEKKESNEKILKVLKIIQRFDPKGIGARDLKERVIIQLEATQNKKIISIIQNHFSDFLKRRSYLSKKLNISKEMMKEIKQEIRKRVNLNPLSYDVDPIRPIIPDLFIDYEDDKWKISLNKEDLPSWKLNKFASLIKTVATDEKKFIKQNIIKGTWLRRGLEKRANNLKEFALFLIKFQKNYLLGQDPLIPVTYRDLATALHVHLSTASRIVANKYVQTPLGIFPMKHFFSSSVKTEKSDISSQEAISILKMLIEKEKKPLSDRELSKKLFEKGIFLSRRTICKYRKKNNILSSRNRQHI